MKQQKMMIAVELSELFKHLDNKIIELRESDRYFPIPSKEDKKMVLDYLEDPNFEDFYYLPKNTLKNLQGKFCETKHPFIVIRKSNCKVIRVDSNLMVILGTQKKPWKTYEPPFWSRETGNNYVPDGEIIRYVCYHSNGDAIREAIDKVIESLPPNASENSVILVFQWKYENPSRSGYYVVPRLVTIKKLSLK